MAVGIALLVAGVAVSAEDQPKAATEGSTAPYRYPQLNLAHTLQGTALVAALREGGYVLFMRHAEFVPPATSDIPVTCGRSDLTARGERDVAFLAAAMRQLHVPIGKILSSPVCRAQDTASRLGLGEVEVTNDLSNMATPGGFDFHTARGKRLAARPAAGTNTLLVSHLQSGHQASQWIQLDFLEIVLYKPDGAGGTEAVARIRADDWYALKQIAIQ